MDIHIELQLGSPRGFYRSAYIVHHLPANTLALAAGDNIQLMELKYARRYL